MMGRVRIISNHEAADTKRQEASPLTQKPQKGREHREPTVWVRKNNPLIQGMGRITLLANKILLTALIYVEERTGNVTEVDYYRRIEAASGTDYSTGLVAEFSCAELMRTMGTKSGSFYRTAMNLMDSSFHRSLKNQWVILVKEGKGGLYGVTDIITATLYDSARGRLFVKFSSEKRIHAAVMDYKSNFTTLNYGLMMRFKSVYSYRIYEIIMSRIGYEDGTTHEKKDRYVFRYGTSELKYMIGILDPFENREVRSALQNTRPDYGNIEAKLSVERPMPRYNDLKRYALDKAKKEIDQADESEYIIDFEPVRGGRGGKVIGIDLIATRKRPLSEKAADVEDKEVTLDAICDMIFMSIGHPLRLADCRAIAKEADYSITKVRKAVDFMLSSGSPIENVTGYLISAIKNDYGDSVRYTPDNAIRLSPMPYHDFSMNF